MQNGGHPKAQASPLSALFFDPSNFAPPSERTDDSKRNSNGSWPAHGVGERRHHDLIAPLIYPRREIKKPMSGGSSSWLLCGRTIFCDFFVFVVLSVDFHFGIKYIMDTFGYFFSEMDFNYGIKYTICDKTFHSPFWGRDFHFGIKYADTYFTSELNMRYIHDLRSNIYGTHTYIQTHTHTPL